MPPWSADVSVRARLVIAAALIGLWSWTNDAVGPAGSPAAAVGPSPADHIYPAASWDSIADPRSVGWTQASLDRVSARLAKTPSYGFLAVVGGRVLLEYGDVKGLIDLASVRKSFLSMLVGIRGVDHRGATVSIDGVWALSAGSCGLR